MTRVVSVLAIVLLLMQVSLAWAAAHQVAQPASIDTTTTTTAASSTATCTTVTATTPPPEYATPEVRLRRPAPPSITDADVPPSSPDVALPEARGPPEVGCGQAAGSIAAGGADDFITLYHGTTKAHAAKIRSAGLDLTKSRSQLDFGRGFYTTDDLVQAQKWAGRAADGGEVLAFRVRASELAQYRNLSLWNRHGSLTRFIRHNRLGGRMHSYDTVSGQMLGNPVKPAMAPKWFRGAQPRFHGSQTSFHSQEAADFLFRGLLP